MLTNYTSYKEVRAMLGVSDTEIDDETLALPIYYNNLVVEFDEIAAALQTELDLVTAKLPADRSVAEEKFYKLGRMFACYSVAKHCLTALPAVGLKRTTDGKAEGERFNFAEAVVTGVTAGYEAMKKRVRGAYAAVEPLYAAPQTTSIVLATSAGLAANPVTGA